MLLAAAMLLVAVHACGEEAPETVIDPAYEAKREESLETFMSQGFLFCPAYMTADFRTAMVPRMINAPVSLLPDAEVRLYNVQDTVKETEYCGRRIGGSKRL